MVKYACYLLKSRCALIHKYSNITISIKNLQLTLAVAVDPIVVK